MKKFFRSFAILVFVFSTFFAGNVFAATKQIEDVLTDDVVTFVEVSPSKLSSFFSEYYASFLVPKIVDELLSYYGNDYELGCDIDGECSDEYVSDNNKKNLKISGLKEYLEEYLSSANLYIGFVDNVLRSEESYGEYNHNGTGSTLNLEDSMFISFKLSDSEYTKNFKPVFDEFYVVSNIDGLDIYAIDGYQDTFISFIDGYLFFSSSKEVLVSIDSACDSYCMNSFSKKKSYINVSKYFLDDNFLNIYINSENFINDLFYSYSDETPVVGILKNSSYGFSLRSLKNDLDILVSGDFYEKLSKELGVEFFNGEVELYKHLDINNVIYMGDMVDPGVFWHIIADNIQLTSFSDEFSYVKDALGDEVMFALYDTNEIFPAVTVMSELGDSEKKFNTDLNTMVDYFVKTLKSESDMSRGDTEFSFEGDAGTLTITVSDEKISGDDVTKFKFEFEFADSKNPYALNLSSDDLTVELFVGIIDDGRFILTTDKNISNNYSSKATSVEVSKFIKGNAVTFDYVNFKAIENFLNSLINKVDKASETELFDVDTLKTIVSTVFAPLDNFYRSIVVASDTIYSTSSLNVDFKMIFDTYPSLFNLVEGVYDDVEALFTYSSVDFSDLDENANYSGDVYYLAANGVINGYDDGTFNPDGAINRAEFTKLMVEILNDKGYVHMYYDLDDRFGDINGYNWYNYYLATALNYGLIHGYEDGNFYPGNTISRAEVAQVVANIIEQFDINLVGSNVDGVNNYVYTDVQRGDWYFDAVHLLTSYELMDYSGEKYFNPHALMTRGESAMVIRRLFDLL